MKNVFFLFLLFPFLSISQTQIQGIVLDGKTKQPLPFATITTSSNFGTLTDIDGKFNIKSSKTVTQISISYVGYETLLFPITKNEKFLKIALNPKTESLKEVQIVARENPALQIIKNTIKNKSKNDIEKSLNSFKFNTYTKILVTANPDSISGNIDSVFVLKEGQKQFKKLDSSNYKFKKEIDKSHLYISEKISEFQFQKGKGKKETVVASRMAGLKEPIYELLAVTFQDLSFYNEYYVLAGTKYINPIADDALKTYNYKILDTVKTESGNSILIYFKPKEKKETLGIEGVLYIDIQSFALTKAIAELKGMINVKATQNYSYMKPGNIWFPQEMDVVLKKGDNKERISLFGGSIKFGESKKNDSIVSTKTKSESDVTYFISKATNTNIEINTPIVVKSAAPTIQFNDDAAKKKDGFWDSYRTDSITERGKNTYKMLDSLVKVDGENIEQKIHIGRNILKGIYPTKYIDLNLGKILNFNNYEGFRVGFGGETNASFSNIFKLESYLAYGTKDRDFKYTIGTSFRLNKNTNTWIGANYTNDLKEAASLDFIAINTTFSLLNLRNLNLGQFYNYKTASAYLKHDIRPNLEAEFQISSGDYKPLFDYQYISSDKNLSQYGLTTAIFGFQYNPKSEYMNSPIGKLRIKNEFPQFTFQLTKSFENVLNGDFDFTQLNFRAQHEIKRLQKATTSILLEGGIVLGDAPISHLFNSSPNASFKNPWANRINFVGKNSFETMGYNEFISDRFAAIHLKHELKPFNFGTKFKPQLIFVTRAAIGDIDNSSFHNGFVFKSLNNGYLESGLEFKSLFKGFGLSTFYRYGANQNPEWSDNLAVKISYKIRLGF
ncbi:MAG: carboxypeptidase-like regulatory domain-containing protein [Flavobacteriaceae bacterium]|nr:carboxypeptidase-like regulatory domain-containing protein [Flavobacteriaceae bacterium]